MTHQWPRRTVRRAVLLIEMDDGAQHGYQIDRAMEATVSWDDPYSSDLGDFCRRVGPGMVRTGRITVAGELTGLSRMPSDAFTPEPELEPERRAIGGTT